MSSALADFNEASELLQDFTASVGPSVRELARYASLPVVLTPELVNLLRVNFQPEISPELDPAIEANLLLSPICTELGNGLYEMHPGVRKQLLVELLREEGDSELRDVATLLWQYSKLFSPWAGKRNLDWAQRLSALNFIDTEHAQRWLEQAENAAPHGQPVDRKWFVAMRKELADKRETLEEARRDKETYGRTRLAEALLSAFSSYPELGHLVSLLVGYIPPAIIESYVPAEYALSLVRWAESEGQTEDLLRLALALHTDNPQILKYAQDTGLDITFDRPRFLMERAELLRAQSTPEDQAPLFLVLFLLIRAAGIQTAQLGDGDAATLATLYEVGTLQEELHQLDQAVSTFKKAHAAALQSLGSGHPLTAQLADKLAEKITGPEVNFTEAASKVMLLAREEAQRFNHNYLGTEHILLGLLREDDGVVARVLNSLGVELHKVRASVEFIIGRGDRMVTGEIGLTSLAERVIELAMEEARRLNQQMCGTEHLLLGLIREGEGIAATVLESLGVSLEKARARVIQVLRSPATLFINTMGKDLTAEAASGNAYLLVSRRQDVERALQILADDVRNSLVFIAKPGIDATSIVRALASRIAVGDVPSMLKGKRIIALVLKDLISRSGDLFKLQHELERLLAEIESEAGILFIEDLVTLLALNSSPLLNVVHTALRRDALQLISIATADEYSHFKARIAPMLYQKILPMPVDEVSVEEAFDILRAGSGDYESRYHVKFTDGAVKAAVAWSHLYIGTSDLLARSAELIEMAASRVRLYRNAQPNNLSEAMLILEALSREKVFLVSTEDYERAADLREHEISLRRWIAQFEGDLQSAGKPEVFYVVEEDVAQVMSMRTGIPSERILDDAGLLEIADMSEATGSPEDTGQSTGKAERIVHPGTLVWDELQKDYIAGSTVQAKVIGSNRGGLLVDVYGLQGFVPASQLSSPLASNISRRKALALYHGRVLRLKIIEVVPDLGRLTLSESGAHNLWQELGAGEVRRGVVVSLTTFGVFVDVGGITGLIHTSELPWEHVSGSSTVLKIGDVVNVVVLSVDPKARRLSLSLKRAAKASFNEFFKKHSLGDVVEGVITRVAEFGVFVLLEGGFQGLIHRSELPDGHVDNQSEVIKTGRRVRVMIIRMDPNRSRIGLSLKRVIT